MIVNIAAVKAEGVEVVVHEKKVVMVIKIGIEIERKVERVGGAKAEEMAAEKRRNAMVNHPHLENPPEEEEIATRRKTGQAILTQMELKATNLVTEVVAIDERMGRNQAVVLVAVETPRPRRSC